MEAPSFTKEQLNEWGLTDQGFKNGKHVWAVDRIEGSKYYYRVSWETHKEVPFFSVDAFVGPKWRLLRIFRTMSDAVDLLNQLRSKAN